MKATQITRSLSYLEYNKQGLSNSPREKAFIKYTGEDSSVFVVPKSQKNIYRRKTWAVVIRAHVGMCAGNQVRYYARKNAAIAAAVQIASGI